jgi:major membrane immunogen (membrane-anchored lipoprotein)
VNSHGLLIAALGAAAALALGGCGESDKEPLAYKKGQYQGKPDTRPWDNTPNTWSNSSWEKGNQASWENAIKTRSLSQNEYTRAE